MSSLGSRYFIIRDDDFVFRMSAAMLKRLMVGSSEEGLPQFAGQKIRFADIVVELCDRKPDHVVRIGYYHLYFKQDGAMDVERFMHDGAVVAEAFLTDALHLHSDPAIIDGAARFAQRERDNIIWWQPYPLLEKMILDAAVDLVPCPRIKPDISS